MSIAENSSSPVKARMRSSSILSKGSAELATNSGIFSPPPGSRSFGPRLRSGSIMLSESSEAFSNSSDADTSANTFVDLGEGMAELKDAVQAPWAPPKLDEDGNVRMPSPKVKKSEDVLPGSQVSAGQKAYLDRILQHPLVASTKYVSSMVDRHFHTSPIKGSQPPHNSPESKCHQPYKLQERADDEGKVHVQGEVNLARPAHENAVPTPASDDVKRSNISVPPGLLPAIALRGNLAAAKPASPFDGRRSLGLSPRQSSPGSLDGGGGRAPPGGVSTLSHTGALEGQRRIGRCKMYNCDKGVGFIIDDHLNEVPYDVKLHWTDIFSDSEFKSLAKGEIIEYTLNITSNGYSASFVTGPGGRPVMGAEASIVSTSRQTSFQLFKANALPAKGYKSKWEGLPKPEGFLSSPTLASGSLNNSPRVGGHKGPSKAAAAALAPQDSAGLGLDFAFNNTVNPHAPVQVRHDLPFAASPASTASPMSLGSWATSPQSLLSSPASPWASSNPFGYPTFGSPAYASPTSQDQHEAFLRSQGFSYLLGRQPFAPGTAMQGSQSMQQLLSEREILLNQQLMLAKQQRALVDLYLRTTQATEKGDLDAQSGLRPRAQTFIPGTNSGDEKENYGVQPVLTAEDKKSMPLAERRIVSDRSTASTSSCASSTKKVKFARSTSMGGGNDALSGVASAERAIQALRDAAGPRRLSPKLMVTKATPVKQIV